MLSSAIAGTRAFLESGEAGGLLDSELSPQPFYHEGLQMATSWTGIDHFALLFCLMRGVVISRCIKQFSRTPKLTICDWSKHLCSNLSRHPFHQISIESEVPRHDTDVTLRSHSWLKTPDILPISGVFRGSEYYENIRTSSRRKRPSRDFKPIEMEEWNAPDHHDHVLDEVELSPNKLLSKFRILT